MTNHLSKARDVLAELDVTDESKTNLPADWCGASDDEQWLVHATLEEAQVHATLAVAEQQLIANLIALGLIDLYKPTLATSARERLIEQHPDVAAVLGIRGGHD
ncbi:MAG: hypothetical protein J0J04_07935 [Microbacterium sp.]|uniref:hypothetical protein n=1 Tax=Microbacterium sp. TaxID=51671 RepID=UPI001AD31B48|nr:hypothetical protein [Microbacterium sp.]MBN9214729.1 hypothetical protein [Microbacterium sp.]